MIAALACVAAAAHVTPAGAQAPTQAPAAPARTPAAQAAAARFAAVLDSMLRTRTYALRLEAGRLVGPGADTLAAEGARAQFILVGEEHGTAEVPRFVGALLGRLRPTGYRHLALEVGPADAALLAELAARGDPGEQLVRLRRAEGTAFAFFSEYADDAALLGTARADTVALWGLDQAFLFSSPSQLARLAALAPNAAARALAAGHHARDRTAARADTGRRSAGRFLKTATAADFQALRAAFGVNAGAAGAADASHADAARLLDDLEESAAIYRLNDEGSPDANARRSRYMKRTLWTYYQAAVRAGDARPRVLFKFGAVHAGRGLSPFGVYDLGNTASELAELHGGTSFHLGVWSHDSTDALYGALRAVPAGSWAVVDLRPLRPAVLRAERAGADVDPGLARLARRYDAVVVAPRLTRSARLPRE